MLSSPDFNCRNFDFRTLDDSMIFGSNTIFGMGDFCPMSRSVFLKRATSPCTAMSCPAPGGKWGLKCQPPTCQKTNKLPDLHEYKHKVRWSTAIWGSNQHCYGETYLAASRKITHLYATSDISCFYCLWCLSKLGSFFDVLSDFVLLGDESWRLEASYLADVIPDLRSLCTWLCLWQGLYQ